MTAVQSRIRRGTRNTGNEWAKVSSRSSAAYASIYLNMNEESITGLSKENPEYTDFKYWKANGWLDKVRPWRGASC